MAIGINDLDDDDLLEELHLDPNSNGEPSEGINLNNLDEFISDFLKTRGIDDISKIKFEDENNQIIERDWKDLSKEEKFNILNTPLEVTKDTTKEDNNLTQDEIKFINLIREQNLTPDEYILSLMTPPEPTYKIDTLSDDEVYLLDLESRVGEMSDEEAAQALNLAKQNEEFFKKQIDGIRKEYKEREDYLNQQEEASLEEERREAYENFRSNIVDAIDGFNSVGNLDLNLEDSDKEYLAEFILSQDETGKNYLWQALQDPKILTKAAWFILNGEDAFNNVSDYFINLIKLVSENQYKKGFEDAKKGVSKKPTVIIDNSKKNVHRSYSTIEDLDDDE